MFIFSCTSIERQHNIGGRVFVCCVGHFGFRTELCVSACMWVCFQRVLFAPRRSDRNIWQCGFGYAVWFCVVFECIKAMCAVHWEAYGTSHDFCLCVYTNLELRCQTIKSSRTRQPGPESFYDSLYAARREKRMPQCSCQRGQRATSVSGLTAHTLCRISTVSVRPTAERRHLLKTRADVASVAPSLD